MTPATAFWVDSPGIGVLRTEEVRDPEPGEVLVRTLYTGISRGTESLVFRGEVPSGEHERMRAPFQEGDFPGPVKYGYLNVGVVEQRRRRASRAARCSPCSRTSRRSSCPSRRSRSCPRASPPGGPCSPARSRRR